MRLFPILLFAMSLFAQQEQLVTLSGVVVNSATGEPVKRASVQVMRISREYFRGAGQPAQLPVVRTTLTDATGAFRFDALPAGEYSCMPRKPQFVVAETKASCAALAPGEPAGRLARAFQTESDGSYDLRYVPAGKYLLFAIEDTGIEYATAEAVRPFLAGAKPVAIEAHKSLMEDVVLTVKKP
jgi:hypothetical protein